jgi:hypothetical protein
MRLAKRGTKPPEGYQLCVTPRYILKRGDDVKIRLGPQFGELLSILMGSRCARIYPKEIVSLMFSGRDDGGPISQWRGVHSLFAQLKAKLREHGVVLLVRSRSGKMGYTFEGFAECEPTYVKKERTKKAPPPPKPRRERKPPFVPNPEAMTTNELKRLKPPKPKPQLPRYQKPARPRVAPPKVLPPEYVAAQMAPWFFPQSHTEAE